MRRRILVIDDEEVQANIIANILEKEGYVADRAYSGEEALHRVAKKEFDVILVDLKMPGMGGMGFLKKIKEKSIDSQVIIMTAYGTIETAVEAMKNGAFDYITKPFGTDELLIHVQKAIDAYELYHTNLQLKEELESLYEETQIVGVSEQIKELHSLIEKVAANDLVNVLITGESGTGKELVARNIHRKSGRSSKPFIAVNCSAIPETLLESELFGYEKGAFTGAVSRREGKFKIANGGTLFLDEIADMPISMQSKLLRVIQDREITPVGGDQSFSLDVRIIAATNRDIKSMVEQGYFRDDLYYRLNVVPIHIPPLREHREDIPVLVEYVREKLNHKLNKNIRSLPPEVISLMMEYNFPGNVRELENIMERAFILSGSNRLSIEHFPMLGHEHVKDAGSNTGKTLKEISREARSLAEKRAIEEALTATNWNRVKAAKRLGIDYKTLRNKMKEFNIIPHYNNEDARKERSTR